MSLFSVSNHHVPSCGPPPAIDGDAPRRYHGYFESCHGEQAVFVYDYASGEAVLYCGDASWAKPYPVVAGVAVGLVLNPDERAWLAACWRAATGAGPPGEPRGITQHG